MAYTYAYPHPAVAVDVVVLCLVDATLSALLVRRKNPPFAGDWALPGGFVDLDESLKHAAWRELKEETGVRAAWLEQLHTFGHPKRDPRERVISVSYLSLLPADQQSLRASSDAADAGWFGVADLPALAFDHARILDRALRKLRNEPRPDRVALRLMPEWFTLPELQRAAEQVAGKTLDARNFRKRVLARESIEAVGRTRRQGAHRPARVYRRRERSRSV
ncbi:MAG: NUDIX domain-containing protein [Woeseiaceae bacterium]|nr:NUDIX domain-containing protein [Woeseiaceae bacterium]